MDIASLNEDLRRDVLDRFLRYVRVYTTSDRHSDTMPSSERQFDLARMLGDELTAMGIEDVTVTDTCYVIARLPASPGSAAEPLLFLAHMDTAPDITGENVHPRVWEEYDGGALDIGNGYALDPEDYPALRRFVGDTIVTTDGSTLLGADDKAGVAEIMTAASVLVAHPEIEHGEIEIVFTPDEEIGRGVDGLDLDALHSNLAFTMDGGIEGSIEAECFSAYQVTVSIDGYVIHPGSAKNKMANAVSIAGRFLSMIPQSESPEATDGRDGFYCPVEVSGSYGGVTIVLIVRDFDHDEVLRRVTFLETLGATMEAAYPRCRVSVTSKKQYTNMAEALARRPEITELLTEAVKKSGADPVMEPIRGGTDGARLTEMGLPTPNVFTGGMNFHGRFEWIPVGSMVKAVQTILNVVLLWHEKRG